MQRFRLLMLGLAATLAPVGCATVPQSAAPEAVDVVVSEQDRQRAIAKRITIIRDDFGVPHIYGKTDADAVFGLLYAQAEDDFPRIERNYLWATGRLAEVQGEAALYSDLRANLYMTRLEAEAAYAAAPEWLRTRRNASACARMRVNA